MGLKCHLAGPFGLMLLLIMGCGSESSSSHHGHGGVEPPTADIYADGLKKNSRAELFNVELRMVNLPRTTLDISGLCVFET